MAPGLKPQFMLQHGSLSCSLVNPGSQSSLASTIPLPHLSCSSRSVRKHLWARFCSRSNSWVKMEHTLFMQYPWVYKIRIWEKRIVHAIMNVYVFGESFPALPIKFFKMLPSNIIFRRCLQITIFSRSLWRGLMGSSYLKSYVCLPDQPFST